MKKLVSLVLALALCAGLAAPAQIADYSGIPDQYKDAVAAVYALGIIGGYSDGTFGGGVTMNRGQAAVVIYRLAQSIDSGSGAAAEDPAPAGAPEAPAPETPANPEPSTPETPPASSDRTLSNGQAITEDNVTAILEQLEVQYLNGTDFQNGYAGLGSGRNAYSNCISQVTTNTSAPPSAAAAGRPSLPMKSSDRRT